LLPKTPKPHFIINQIELINYIYFIQNEQK